MYLNLGTLFLISGNTWELSPCTGNTGNSTDTLSNGSATTTLNFSGPTNTPVIYTAYPNLFCTVNADCCIGNNLRKQCDCECTDNALNCAFMKLMIAKEQSQCFQYNASLDTLYQVQLYCNNSDCGCGSINNANNV